MIWEKLSGTKSIYADVPGCGRYLIRWSKDDKAYRAFVNGKRTVYTAKKIEDVQKMIERVHASVEQFNREHEHDVQITELTLENLARKCAELERRVRKLEDTHEHDDHREQPS